VLQCSRCGTQFFRPENQVDNELAEDASPPDMARAVREEELDGLRIRQISTLRRAVYRTRSYFVIAGGACFVTAIQLATMIYHRAAQTRLRMPLSDGMLLAGYVLLMLAALGGAFYFERRIVALTRELRKPTLENPENTPDFSPLSDGTQHVQNLENLRE